MMVQHFIVAHDHDIDFLGSVQQFVQPHGLGRVGQWRAVHGEDDVVVLQVQLTVDAVGLHVVQPEAFAVGPL